MRRLILLVAAVLASAALAQKVGRVYDLPNARADSATVSRLPDGGAALHSSCVVPFEDGGFSVLDGNEELNGAAQAQALGILNGRAKAACKLR